MWISQGIDGNDFQNTVLTQILFWNFSPFRVQKETMILFYLRDWIVMKPLVRTCVLGVLVGWSGSEKVLIACLRHVCSMNVWRRAVTQGTTALAKQCGAERHREGKRSCLHSPCIFFIPCIAVCTIMLSLRNHVALSVCSWI